MKMEYRVIVDMSQMFEIYIEANSEAEAERIVLGEVYGLLPLKANVIDREVEITRIEPSVDER